VYDTNIRLRRRSKAKEVTRGSSAPRDRFRKPMLSYLPARLHRFSLRAARKCRRFNLRVSEGMLRSIRRPRGITCPVVHRDCGPRKKQNRRPRNPAGQSVGESAYALHKIPPANPRSSSSVAVFSNAMLYFVSDAITRIARETSSILSPPSLD